MMTWPQAFGPSPLLPQTYQQRAGSKVGLLELELAPIQDSSSTNGSLTHYVMAPAPHTCSNIHAPTHSPGQREETGYHSKSIGIQKWEGDYIAQHSSHF